MQHRNWTTVCLLAKGTATLFLRERNECEISLLRDGKICKKDRTGEEGEALYLKMGTAQ